MRCIPCLQRMRRDRRAMPARKGHDYLRVNDATASTPELVQSNSYFRLSISMPPLRAPQHSMQLPRAHCFFVPLHPSS
eukprot:1159521-Pelagomonas_calceolata.AAC.14